MYLPVNADTPEQPVNVTVTEVRPFSVALSWVEPHDNNAPISDYIIDITAVGTGATRMVRANASVEAFNVTDLLPFVNYSFTVRAENDEGLGRPSTPVFQQTLEFCEWVGGAEGRRRKVGGEAEGRRRKVGGGSGGEEEKSGWEGESRGGGGVHGRERKQNAA